MKKVIILSYYFPPCNLTAANRIGSWEKYLPESRIYPIIVTRNWTGNELTEEDRLEKSGEKIRHIKKENAEIYYMPYRSSFRDQCFIKGRKYRLFALFSKMLTMFHLFFQNFTIRVIPYRNLYFQVKKILQENKEIRTLVISGNPFEQFYFGYLLKKEFPNLKWLADYRDDWTTTELVKERTFLQKFLLKIERTSEKKWIEKSNLITSVSDYYAEKIALFNNVKGRVLFNGFDDDLLGLKHIQVEDCFNITYNGSLYETQHIEPFLSAFRKLVDRYKGKVFIRLNFPGLMYNKQQALRVKKELIGYEDFLFISDRIPKRDVLEMQLKSDVLLMISHKNLKGIPSSKVFEYIGLRKPILLYPSDDDILEKLVGSFGVVANSKEECYLELEKMLKNKIDKKVVKRKLKSQEYSARNQVNVLAKILYEL